MQTKQSRLYYDASCGFCRREIEHLRPRLEPQVELVDISAQGFQPPRGYSLTDLYAKIHFDDGQKMHIGFPATLAYWKAAGLKKTSGLLGLPGIFHCGNWLYNLWAAKRQQTASRCSLD